MFDFTLINLWPFFISFTAFMIVFFGVNYLLRKNSLNKKVSTVIQDKFDQARVSSTNASKNQQALFSKKPKPTKSFILQYINNLAQETTIQYRILFEQAGFSPINASLVATSIKLGLGVSFGILGWILLETIAFLSQNTFILKVLLEIVIIFSGFLAFDYFMRFLIQRRQKRIKAGFSNMLDLLVLCIKAGLNIDKSFEYIATELKEVNKDICKEFSITSFELNMLPSRETAYTNLARRVTLPMIHALTTTLKQAEEQGTPIAQSLANLSENFHKKQTLEVEAKAAKLASLLIVPVIFFTLPSLVITLLAPAIIHVLDTFNS